MNKNKIYVMLLISLLSSHFSYSAEQPAWLDENNDGVSGRLHEQYSVDAENSSLLLDVTPIVQLQNRLDRYAKSDSQLFDLNQALNTQKEQINQYNQLINNQLLPNDQKETLIQSAVRDILAVSPYEIERLKKLTSVIIQSKNLDPSWQIKEQGYFWGSCSFIRNLFIPRDWQSYCYAGAGALAGLTVLKSSSKPMIQINLPAGASTVTINDNSQQKIMGAVAACALGAGVFVAGTQLYNSWMHESNSRNDLVDDIRGIKNSNLNILNIFSQISLGMKVATHAAENQASHAVSHTAIASVDSRVAAVQNVVMAVDNRLVENNQASIQRHNDLKADVTRVQTTTEGVSGKVTAMQSDVCQLAVENRAMHAMLDEIAQAQGLSKLETVKLKQAFERAEGKVEELFENIQAELGDVKGAVVASAVMNIQMHQETTNNFRALNQRISYPQIMSSLSSSSQQQATTLYSGPSFLYGTAVGRAMALPTGVSGIPRLLQLVNESGIPEVD